MKKSFLFVSTVISVATLAGCGVTSSSSELSISLSSTQNSSSEVSTSKFRKNLESKDAMGQNKQ